MVIVLHLNVCVVLLVLLSQKKGRILKLLMTSLAKGEDKAYVEWFEQIVEHAKNKDFPIAFEEFFHAKEWKFTSKEPLTYPPFTTNMKKRQ